MPDVGHVNTFSQEIPSVNNATLTSVSSVIYLFINNTTISSFIADPFLHLV